MEGGEGGGSISSFLICICKKEKRLKKKKQGVRCLILKATREVPQPLQDPQWNKYHSLNLGSRSIVAHIHPKSLMFC